MKQQLHVLMVEDSEDDAILLTHHLQHGDFEVKSERVQTADSFVSALESREWDAILCDYRMPNFNGLQALNIVKERGIDAPFIFVSGTMGEETAVEAMKAGAHDYVMKNNLTRLISAVARELHEAKIRKERKQAEDTVKKMQILLDEIQRITKVGGWEYDVATARVTWTDEVYNIYGVSKDYNPQSPDEDITFYAPEDQGLVNQAFKQAVEEGRPYDLELQLINAAGNRLWVKTSGRVEYRGDKIVRVFGNIMDITERKIWEQALQKSEEKFRRVIETALEGVWFLDSEFKTTEVNDAVIRMLGYTREELIGKSFIDLVVDEERSMQAEEFQHRKRGIGGQYERRVRCKDGSEKWLSLSVQPVMNTQDEFVGSFGMVTEITERKRADDAIRESEERFRMVFENVFDGISIHLEDPDPSKRRLIDCNEQYAAMAGRTREELLKMGSTLDIQTTLADSASDDRLNSLNQGSSYRGSFSWIRPDRKVNIIESASVPIIWKGKLHSINIDRNVTERKQAETKILESEERYRSLFMNMLNGFAYCKVLFDQEKAQDFLYLEVNDAFEKLTGLKDVVGKKVTEIIPGIHEKDPEVFEIYGRVALTGNPVTLEIYIASLDAWHSVTVDSPRKEYFVSVFAVITERKKAEEALQNKERYQRALLDNFPFAVWLKDTESRFLAVNELFAKTFNIPTADELVGKSDFDITTPDIAEAYRADDRAVLESRRKNTTEEERVSLGERRWLETYKAPVIGQNGELFGTVGFLRDITERKQSEEALTYERNLLRALMENTPDHVYFKDKDSRFLRISGAQARHFGLDDPAQAVGKTDFDFFEEKHARQALEDEQEIMKSGVAIVDLEEMESRPNGRDTWVSTTKVPFRGEQGEIIGTFGISRDITIRKQAEKERRRLATAIEQVAEAILITDPRGIIQYVNPAFEQITGHRRSGVNGQTPRLLKSGRQNVGFYEELWKTISAGGKWRGRFINKKKDGTLFTDETTISPVFGEKGEIINYVGVKRDITEELSLQTQLAQAQKLEGIGTLASGIAHDFNNILGIILGHSSLLERLREDANMHSVSVAAITKATQRGASLVKQLMLFARKAEPLLESVKVNNIIGELTKLLQETFPKTVSISTALQRDLPSIIADSSQIHQVLLNLLVNARDAMPKGGTIAITTSIVEGETVSSRFAKAAARQYVKVEIADTGIGMDEATRQRIFEPFFTTKGPGKGTGLGLAVVFGIVEYHNGFIDVRSALGEGTSFDVYLPVPEHAMQEVPVAKKGLEEIPGGTETVLIIEDEEMLKSLAKGILVSKGYTVLTAEDGMQGVELYRNHQKEIAVVLSDIGLPILDGHDVFRKIRTINPKAKIIFASGYFDPETKSEMFKAGLKNFIQKPYMHDEVLQKIREAIDTK